MAPPDWSRSRSPTLVVSLVVLVLTGSSCGGLPFTGASPDQRLRDSVQSFESAPSIHMSGVAVFNNLHYKVDLTVGRSAAQGMLTFGDQGVGYMSVNGTGYMSGRQYYANLSDLGKLVGDRWVKASSSNPIEQFAAKLVDRKKFGDSVLSGRSTLADSDGPVLSGKKTRKLADSAATFYVSDEQTPELLRIDVERNRSLSDGLSDSSLDVSYSTASFVLTPPPQPVDLAEPDTLPPDFEIAPNAHGSFRDCDANGCTSEDTFINLGGKAGQASVTFSVYLNGAQVASCDVDLPSLSHGQQVTLSCRLNWDRSAGSASGRATVHNPPV